MLDFLADAMRDTTRQLKRPKTGAAGVDAVHGKITPMLDVGGSREEEMMPERTMLAARVHEYGSPLVMDEIPIPTPCPDEVLVEVKACGIVPNLRNVLMFFKEMFPYSPLPEPPAIFGLDVTGVVTEIGSKVFNFKPGDRVFVNPVRGCGTCKACRGGKMTHCEDGIFQGYFGFGPKSQQLFSAYPYGGLCEFQTAPAYSLVALPDTLSFEHGVRLGYMGTAYAGFRKAGLSSADTLLVNGVSGTLGLGAVLVALAIGIPRILGVARNPETLQRVKAIAPSRIEVHSTAEGSTAEWARALTGGSGVDVMIDTLGAGAPGEALVDAIYALNRGGRAVNVGGIWERTPLDLRWMMDKQINLIGSCWFDTREGQALADMAKAGTLDMSLFENRRFPLAKINEAIENMPQRDGGFTNFVMVPKL